MPDIEQATTQARNLALLAIAQRAQTDLYYLCKHILGYDLMTEQTHGELCELTATLAPRQPPHSARNGSRKGMLAGTIVSDSPYTDTKNYSPSSDTHTKNLTAPFADGSLSSETESRISGSLVSSPPTPRETVGVTSSPFSGPKPSQLNPIQALTDPEELFPVKTDEQDYDQFSPDKNQLLLLMPRGTFKSSVVTIGFTLQMLLLDQDVRILIDSETFQKAKAFLMEIKGHLEGNEKYREIFKTLYGVYPDARKRDDIWSDAQLNIAARKRARKEPTLSCGGVDVTKNGMHYDLIIMDDLHSELNTVNKDQIDKVVQHFKLAYSLLDPGKPLIVIGTRWDYNDTYQYILDNESNNFNIMVRKAHNKDGSLFFPERLTEAFLDKTKKTMGSYLYSCQYENEPVDDESATFKRSLLVRRPWELVKDQPMNWYMAVDPSYEGPYSDYAALVVAGMNHTKDLYVRYVLRQKMTYGEIINQMFEIYNQHPEIKQIVLETVATQKSIQYELNNEQKRRGTWLPVTEIKSRTKSKEERIRALAPFYEFGHVFHVRECPQLDDLEYELIHFPKGTHDDIIDALATILEVARPSGNVEKRERRQRNSHLYDVLTKPRSPITGV